MAKKDLKSYVCANCGAKSTTWSGKCFACGEWNTFEEQVALDIVNIKSSGKVIEAKSVQSSISKDHLRFASGVGEVDIIFGGGIVEGSVNLIAGQPGIGKSTLLLQLADSWSNNYSVMYISAEESLHQIGIRAKRIGVANDKLNLATSTSADDIAKTIMEGKQHIVVVDSVQTIACESISSSTGSVSQITNSTSLITAAAKQSGTAVILVGHVTKEGSIAGPKIMEHLVDVVLQLEGDRYGGFKILRAVKNRYGSTSEAGIFEMIGEGLRPVDNPSAALLAERQVSDGSVVLATLEGTRPLLVEVQALVNRTNYGYPKRAASGMDLNRLNLLIAMLERRTKLNLADQDVYVNIVGGIKLSEPAADLAVAMAVASAAKNMQLDEEVVVFGELGLSGEVRHVPFLEKRLAEAKKLGFKTAIGPIIRGGKTPKNYISVRDIKSALNTFLVKR